MRGPGRTWASVIARVLLSDGQRHLSPQLVEEIQQNGHVDVLTVPGSRREHHEALAVWRYIEGPQAVVGWTKDRGRRPAGT